MKNNSLSNIVIAATKVAEQAAIACYDWIGKGNEKLADHLKVKTYLKRQVILTKYTNEDGTCETPPLYEDIHPECTLYQYGTLMNDNSGVRVRAIEEYRHLYLESEDKGLKMLA